MDLRNEMKTGKNMSNHGSRLLFFKEEEEIEHQLMCCIFPVGNKLNELAFRILSALYPAHFV